jgi:glucokinase
MNGVGIKKILEKKFHTRTAVDNDARCFALGEAARLGKKNLVGITLGTGFGGGIVIGGEIYHGLGSAGEFGHMTLHPGGRACTCGNAGCLEEYVSGRGIEKDSEKIYGERINPEALANMARKGDGKARQMFETFGRNLGIGLANISNILNPEIISVGGGISQAHDLFLCYALEELKKRSFVKVPKIIIGKTDGSVGAAIMGMQKP